MVPLALASPCMRRDTAHNSWTVGPNNAQVKKSPEDGDSTLLKVKLPGGDCTNGGAQGLTLGVKHC